MNRYTVFYQNEIHSQAEGGSLHGLLQGDPEDSVIYDNIDTDQPWFDKRITAIKEENVAPVIRMLVLLHNL